jgi:hypothetical protein
MHESLAAYAIFAGSYFVFALGKFPWMKIDRPGAAIIGMGMTEVIAAPSSPWQNPFAARLIGSLRRECLDHVIILSEQHLRRVLSP